MIQEMKTAATALLGIGFIGLSVFGFLAMGHNELDHRSDCFAATAGAINGVDCPRQTEPLGLANFHLNVFKTFSLAIITALTLFLTAALFAFVYFFNQIPTLFSHLPSRAHPLVLPLKARRQRWLAFHENSPNLA